MILFKIILSICCLITIIVIYHHAIGNNRNYFTNHTSIGWWIIGIAISQLFILTIFALWWEKWWEAHTIILKISAGITILFSILWAIIEIGRRR